MELDITSDFYVKFIAPKLCESQIDKWLLALNNESEISEQNILKILEIHSGLTNLFYELTELNKRSLSSKYLHFHKPNLFFIYDSLGSGALSKFIGRIKKQDIYSSYLLSSNDTDYSKFFIKCLILKDKIKNTLGIDLTPRQLDNFLIDIANNGTIMEYEQLPFFVGYDIMGM